MFENNSTEKCPLCQKKMKLKGGSLVCNDCGYVLNKSGEASSGSYTTSAAPTGVPYNNSFEKNITTNGYHKPQTQKTKVAVGNRVNAQPNSAAKLIALITILMVGGFGVAFVGTFMSFFRETEVQNDYEYENAFAELEDFDVDIEDIEDLDNDYVWDENELNREDFTWGIPGYDEKEDGEPDYLTPDSTLYRAFVKEAFGKEYDKVTEAEYGSITYLYEDDYENLIKYAINDGEVKEYYYENSLYGYAEDFSCFPNLKKLEYVHDEFYEGELAGLTELTELIELHCRNTPAELLELLECPEKLVTLEMYDSYYGKSLEGIEAFTSLKNLYVDASYLEDLKGLDKLEHLEVLVLENASSIKNFTELGKLTTLKKFNISSYALKNLTIMENMKGLEELSISNTQVTDISVLGNHKDTLKKITLVDNYDVKDLSVLSDMTHLEEAHLECRYEGTLPDFSKMTGLKILSLEGNGEIANISTAKSVEDLTLTYCYLEDLTVLSGLTGLKSLTLGNIYNNHDNLHALMSLNSLEKLNLNGLDVFGNIEELFALPNLKELYLEKAAIGLDCAKITGSEKLEILNLSNARIYNYKEPEEDEEYYYFYNYDEVDMNAESAVFAKFPNLKELYLEGMGLENIEFASSLKNLSRLDISNNNVSSLVPLANLTNMEWVRCAQNTIGNDGGLGDKIIFE